MGSMGERGLVGALRVALALGPALLLAACFAPGIDSGQYTCGGGPSPCPDGFVCQLGQCVRSGDTTDGGGPADVPVGEDRPGDLGRLDGAPSIDRPILDGSGPDLVTDAAPVDVPPGVDVGIVDAGPPDGPPPPDVPINPGTFSSYRLEEPPPVPFVDACSLDGHTDLPPGVDGDDGVALAQPIGFDFTLYALKVSQLGVAINGGLLLDPGATATDENPQHTGLCLPTDVAYPSVIGGLREDLLVQGTSSICWVTQGTAPERQFVVTWNDLNFFFDSSGGQSDPGAHLTFTVILNEADQSIEVLYASVDGGSFGTDSVGVGVQNADFTAATQYTCKDQVKPLAAGMHLRFVPQP
jgi:hypothetical protein